MQDGRKAVWSIPNVSVTFFPSLKQNFIPYRSSKVSWRPDYIFEIHHRWQSGPSRVYSNCCCSCSFEPDIIKIGQSSHQIHSNKIMNFQESTVILKCLYKKVWKLIECKTYIYIYIYIYICSVRVCVRMCNLRRSNPFVLFLKIKARVNIDTYGASSHTGTSSL